MVAPLAVAVTPLKIRTTRELARVIRSASSKLSGTAGSSHSFSGRETVGGGGAGGNGVGAKEESGGIGTVFSSGGKTRMIFSCPKTALRPTVPLRNRDNTITQ